MHDPVKKSAHLTAGSTSTAEKLCFDKNEFMKVSNPCQICVPLLKLLRTGKLLGG